MKKLLSLFLAVVLLGQTIFVPVVAIAQEATPEPTPIIESTVEATPEPSTSTEPTATPAATPAASVEPVVVVSPTPTPAPTRPPYSSPEYDTWKTENDKVKAQRDAREVEWEANEENKEWVASHGGSEEYYVSGQWQKDQEAKAAAEAAAKQASPSPDIVDTQTQAALENDPFVNVDTPNQCSEGGQEQESLGLESSAADAFGSEEGSGTNTAIANNNDSANISNTNCAAIGTNSNASGTSGSNTMHQNDGSVSMNTGTSNANGQLVNNGNLNVTDGDSLGTASSSTDDSLAEDTTAENLNTGEDSENFTESNVSTSLTVQNDNAAYVNNQMDVEGTSGDNTLTENDGDVQLTTGDIELIANMLNILNLNITGDDFLHLIVNIFGTLDGNLDLDDIALALGYQDDDDLEILAKNDSTGEDSTNTASVNQNNSTDINNNNTAVVNNEMNVSGVSGQNNASENDGGVDMITGRIQILANMMNFINSNFSGEKWSFIMVNIFGSLNGNLILPSTNDYLDGQGGVTAQNVNGGEDSVNNQSASSIDQTSVSNTNGVQLTNNINANGISGNNNQDGNDDDGEHTASTGVVDVQSQIMNFLNFNITGNNWVFLVVNVFGTWMGQIVGYGDNGPLAGPQDGSFTALSVGSGGASNGAINSNTGEGSTNNASTNSTNQTNVSNNNNAIVNNTMNIDGISGENTVNHNEEATKITTGWVEIDANLLNIINMNVTGRSWMIVFLNVFGDFNGDMFFGRDTYNQYAAANNQNQGIGGESSSQNNSSNSNNSPVQSNESHNGNSSTNVATVLGTKNGKIATLNILGQDSDEESYETFAGVTFEPQTESNESAPAGILGFFLMIFNTFKRIAHEVYLFAKAIVEPALVYASAQ